MGAEMLLMMVQYVYGADIENAKGYITKRLLLSAMGKDLIERDLTVKEKQIVLETVLELAESVGIIDELTDLIFENDFDKSSLI